MTAGLEQVLDKGTGARRSAAAIRRPGNPATIVAATMRSYKKPDDKGDGNRSR